MKYILLSAIALFIAVLGLQQIQQNAPQGFTIGSAPASVVVHITPDPTLTPGATNPDVTQANINQTICKANWTATIRPDVTYTNALKKRQMGYYGYTSANPADFEEDHLISLVLGGSPTNPGNLWPQSYKTTPNARNKDAVEMYLRKKVCNGTMTLIEAQTAIRTNWTAVYGEMITKAPLGSVEIQGLQNNDQDDE